MIKTLMRDNEGSPVIVLGIADSELQNISKNDAILVDMHGVAFEKELVILDNIKVLLLLGGDDDHLLKQSKSLTKEEITVKRKIFSRK